MLTDKNHSALITIDAIIYLNIEYKYLLPSIRKPRVSALISVNPVSSLDTTWLNISHFMWLNLNFATIADGELSHFGCFLDYHK